MATCNAQRGTDNDGLHLKKEGHNEVGKGGQNHPEQTDYRVLRQNRKGGCRIKNEKYLKPERERRAGSNDWRRRGP